MGRQERREQTRSELVGAARSVFLRRGFHAASLDEIAAVAGFTKGAVYSNFAGKDELFVAVLAAHFAARVEVYEKLIVQGDTIEEAYRDVGRFMAEADRREPAWAPLLLEFWSHASRRDELRRIVVAQREAFLEAIAGVIAQGAARHGVRYRIPVHEVARASGALYRGLTVERMLDPATVTPDHFAELHAAFLTGLQETAPDAAPS
jgi:AcrR family transcriptional regulator